MSDYAITPDALRERLTTKELAQLTTDSGSGAPDDTIIDAAIDAAESEIHLAAAVYYQTPIAAIAGASAEDIDALAKGIREKILDLAAYKLLQRKPQILNIGERNVYWSQLRKSIDAWLDQISTSNKDRRRVLPSAIERTSGAVTTSGGAFAESDGNEMTRDKLTGWR